MKRKWLSIGIILLFVLSAGTPIPGISSPRDDITPPVTTISLNPPEPDGENGWYVNNVTVTLNATDNESGVNITKYRIKGESWKIYTEPFTLTKDGNNILIEYSSIDAAGNTEPVKNATIDIDRTKPVIALNYTWEKFGNYYLINIIAVCSDATSGIAKVEFYLDDILQKTILGSGPEHVWTYYYAPLLVRGLIRNCEFTDEYVKFYALIVFVSRHYREPYICSYAYDNAGNNEWATLIQPTLKTPIVPGIYLFQNMTIPSNYTGYVGRFVIRATLWGGT